MKKTREQRIAEKAQRNSLSQFAANCLGKLELRGKRIGTHLGLPQGTLLGQRKEYDIWFYFRRLKGEAKELQQAIKRHDIKCNAVTRDAVISEACDIANFAAAIAEKAVEITR